MYFYLYSHHLSVIKLTFLTYFSTFLFLSQLYSSLSGTQHPRHLSLRWHVCPKRTTRGCTPWTPSWSPSSSWAPWASCSGRSAPASSCTAPAPTAACRHAPPPPWRTTTSNCTTDSSTRSNWTNSAAAPRREGGREWKHKRRPEREREIQPFCENLSLFSSFPPVHFSVSLLPQWCRSLDTWTTRKTLF